MTTSYTYWEQCLAGVPFEDRDFARTVYPEGNAYENPQWGYYRKSGPPGQADQAVAIWVDEDGDLICLVDGRQVTDRADQSAVAYICEKVWPFCMERAVPHEVYQAVAENGELWPDDPGLGHNVATKDDELSVLTDQIESALKVAETYKDIEDKDTADKAANVRDRLTTLKAEIDEKRMGLRRPLQADLKKIQDQYKPWVDKLDRAARRIKKLLTPYLKKLEVEKLQEALEAAQKGEAPPAPETRVARVGGAGGRRTSLRSVVETVTITDYAKALDALKDEPEVREAVETAAKRRARSDVETPGVTINKDRKAA